MGHQRYHHNTHPKPKPRPSRRTRASYSNAEKRWENVPKQTEASEASTHTADPPAGPPRPDTPTSASAKKFARFEKLSAENEKLPFNYLFLHRDSLEKLSKCIVCQCCFKAQIVVRYEETHGFCKKILFVCENCYEIHSETYTSPRVHLPGSTRPPFQINQVLVEAFLSIGTGYAAMEKFCIQVEMEIMASRSWENHLKHLLSKSAELKKTVLDKSREAVRQAHMEVDTSLIEDDVLDICISIDGSWQMRGHASSNGLVASVDVLTGLVIDYEIMSKYCHMCQMQASNLVENSPEYIEWEKKHKLSGECQKNFEGSSGSMEMVGAQRIFQRSLQEGNMRYTTMLSDGDAKTFQHLQSLNIYPDIELEKEECVNHVAKRMGTGLREKVKQCKAQKITLGGRSEGALTDNKINKLTGYYRKAIVNNIPNVKAMENAIFATLEHCSSTDQKPKHTKCPKGVNSWCFYNKAKAMKLRPKSHSEMTLRLNDTVYKQIKPVYQRLSSKELLERCLSGGTQNVNECLHSVIWTKQPKGRFVSRNRLEWSVTMAVSEFNMGCSAAHALQAEVKGREVTEASETISERRDTRRKRKSEGQKEATATRAIKRQNKKSKKTDQQDYGAGKF